MWDPILHDWIQLKIIKFLKIESLMFCLHRNSVSSHFLLNSLTPLRLWDLGNALFPLDYSTFPITVPSLTFVPADSSEAGEPRTHVCASSCMLMGVAVRWFWKGGSRKTFLGSVETERCGLHPPKKRKSPARCAQCAAGGPGTGEAQERPASRGCEAAPQQDSMSMYGSQHGLNMSRRANSKGDLTNSGGYHYARSDVGQGSGNGYEPHMDGQMDSHRVRRSYTVRTRGSTGVSSSGERPMGEMRWEGMHYYLNVSTARVWKLNSFKLFI